MVRLTDFWAPMEAERPPPFPLLPGSFHRTAEYSAGLVKNPRPAQRRCIGSLIETPHFYPYLSLEKNLKIICDIKGLEYSDIDRVLDSAKLLERKRSRFSTMSLGMKQSLGLAAALAGGSKSTGAG